MMMMKKMMMGRHRAAGLGRRIGPGQSGRARPGAGRSALPGIGPAAGHTGWPQPGALMRSPLASLPLPLPLLWLFRHHFAAAFAAAFSR